MVRGRWRFLGVAVALAGLLGIAVDGRAQTGSIRGKVLDAEGNPVPGATIKITSPGLLGDRTTYSLDNGAYNFASIPTGTYVVESTLAGFAPSRIENVVVGLGQTRDVPIKMTLQSVTQEIQVVGEAPQLDATTNETGGRVEYEELIKVPTARDPWAVLNLIPSVQTDRINVGASESGQQSTFVSKGDDGDGATWNVDGVNITDQVAIGASPTYYDFGAIEEIQVTTGGTDASQMTGGVGINIVTKRGSNDIKGSARSFFSNDGLQADNSPELDELRATYSRFLTDNLLEFGGEVGFPIIKDKLWGWASGNRNKIENTVVTTAINGNQTTQADNTELINYGGKLNAAVIKNNEASFLYEFGDKKKEGRDAGATRPPETTWNQKGGSPLYKIEDQHIFGSNLILAAKYGQIGGGFELHPQGGGTYEDLSGPRAWRDVNLTWHGTYFDHVTDRPNSTLTLSGNYFATTGNVDHEFKAGFTYRTAEYTADSFISAGEWFVELNANHLSYVQYDQKLNAVASEKQYSFYAQDTLNAGKLTVNIGGRFDSQEVKSDGGVHSAHPSFPDLAPEKVFEGGDAPFTWSNFTPRIGLNYELDDKTIAKASYAMYVDNLDLGLGISTNPAAITSYLNALGYDTNGDGRMDQSELVTPVYGPYGPDPTAADFGNRIDPDLKSPKTHEAVLSLDRQLGPDLVVGISGTWRQRYDEVWNPPMVHEGSGADRVATRADFVVANVLAGAYTQDGENFTYTEPYYTLAPGVEYSQRTFYTNRPDYKENFLGGELMLNKRFSDHWLLGGSFAISDWTLSYDPDGPGAFPDPTRTLDHPYPETGEGQIAVQSTGSGSKGNVFMNANWQSSLRAAYSIEVGPGNVELGTNLTLRQGYPIPVVDSSGRSALSSGARTILVSDLDELRHDNPFIADFRLAYTPTFGRVGLELGVDVFNAFNSDIVLQQRREANLRVQGTPIPIFGSPTEVVGPRMFRFGARVTF
jgi:hypothetical protein